MAIIWNKTDLPTLAEKKAKMISETCQALIYSGIDVELSTGKQHFSLNPNDQTNIDSMFTAVTLGTAEYPYHSDGNPCTMFSAADIVILYVAYKSFITKQTTYCNFARAWIARETDPDVLGSIEYGSPLPDDLAEQMNTILARAADQIQGLIGTLNG